MGRVSRESVTVSGRTYYIGYTWDKNGNMATLRYPDGRTVTYTFDLADRPFKAVGVKQGVVKTYFDSTYYLPFGPDTIMKLGNGIKVRHYFNRKLYADSITNSVAGKFGRSYRYDHNGNITRLLDLIDSTKSYHTITYDGVDRLTQAYGLYRTDSLFFTYYKNGNRKDKRKGNQTTTTYNYTNNRLTSTTGAEAVTYQYNANGSDTSDGAPRYDYDKLNRLLRIRGLASPDSSAYDGENRRVYSKDNGVQFVNFYDIFGNLLSQYDLGSAFYTTDYIWANGEPRMKIDTLIGGLGPLAPPSNPETQFWYHTDHLGTPYVATDSFKSVRWKISLDPFGETVSEQNTSSNLRFPGQYLDRGSGLDYNWNRYYQPKIGRYYQKDPIIARSGEYDYSYADANPLLRADPRGLFSYEERKKMLTVNAGVLLRLANSGAITDCEALARFADFAAGFHEGFWFLPDDVNGFLEDFSQTLSEASGPMLSINGYENYVTGFKDRGFRQVFKDQSNQVRHFAASLLRIFTLLKKHWILL